MPTLKMQPVDDAERTTITLAQPVTFGSETYGELNFRPLKGKDLRKLKIVDGYSMDVILSLAGKLAGVPTQVIDELSGDDLGAVIALVSGFMPGSPSTGETPSEP
jgi:hypothetical protein